MITLYAWSTPNGRKPLILLEELGVPYTLRPVPLDGAQKTADYVTPARRPLRATMDLSRLERHFGVTPRHWREALKDIVGELNSTPS